MPEALQALRRWLGGTSGEATPLGDDGIILVMRTDPDPIDAVFDIQTKRPIMRSDSYHPEVIDLFEVERRMPRIRLQEGIVLIREIAYMPRQSAV